MRLAIPYYYKYSLNDKVDEFNIYFDPNKNDFNDLMAFVQECEDRGQMVNITYRNGIDTRTALALDKMYDNVRFVLTMRDYNALAALKEKGCKYYFDEEHSCETFSDIVVMVETFKVCAIYVSNDLCYNLQRVRDYADKYGVDIRVVLNKVPLKLRREDPTIPIWVPQDMDALERYFDVAEFDLGEDKEYDFKQLEVLYKVWFKDRDWAGNMQEISAGVPFPYVPRTVVPGFGRKKMNCRFACKTEGRSCTMCQQILELSETMQDRLIQFNRKE